MTPEQFCYWLQGYFEITKAAFPEDHELDVLHAQTLVIQNHLQKVFNKDPIFVTGFQNVGDPQPIVNWPEIPNSC